MDPNGNNNTLIKRQDTFTLAEYEKTPLETNYLLAPNQSPASEVAAAKKQISARPTLEALQEAVDCVPVAALRDAESQSPATIASGDPAGFSSTNSHAGDDIASDKTSSVEHAQDVKPSLKGPQFGWIQGVLVRCLLNIWSVLLFIRLSWVVGEAGVMGATAIIVLSAVVCFLTVLSMSAICTNGVVRGGGAYFMISRSLGPEFGGAIGLVFSLANAAAAAMHVVGFAETVSNVLLQYDMPIIRDQPLNDIRIIGCVTVVVLFAIVMIGMEWEARAQLVLLIVLLTAMLNFVVGTFFPPTEYKMRRGFTGYSAATFAANFGPVFSSHSFVDVFAVFFPAVTGILAGANISGDLRDAQTAIPKGTLLAVFLASSVYVTFGWILGATVVREARGPYVSENESSLTLNSTNLDVANPGEYRCTTTSQCAFGLLNDFRSMELASAFGPLVLAGIVAASVSSGLASLVSAPKIFQALASDRLFPYIHFFAKGYGKNNEPWRAYVLTFFIAVACILIADLNVIAPIISQFFLTVYALINYACFDASRSDSPGFRPRFRCYSKWTALAGAALCVAVMFAMSWRAALVSICVIGLLWFYIHYVSKPQVSWGTSLDANVYRRTLEGALKLTTEMEEHVKTYRPQVLVLCGYPANRPALVDVVGAFAGKARALMICGHVMTRQHTRPMCQQLQKQAYEWLKRRQVEAFYAQITSPTSLRQGARALMECAGVGRLRPNVVFLGYLTNWLDASFSASNCRRSAIHLDEYVEIIRDAFEFNMGVGLLKLSESGMDMHEFIKFDDEEENESSNKPDGNTTFLDTSKDAAAERPASAQDETSKQQQQPLRTSTSISPPVRRIASEQLLFSQQLTKGELILLEKVRLANNFHKGQVLQNANKEIHVWWLYDDGGLTVLIPHLLTQNWTQFKLRVFYLKSNSAKEDERRSSNSTTVSDINKIEVWVNNESTTTTTNVTTSKPDDTDTQQMMQLLGKLRIDVDDATPVSLVKPTLEEGEKMLDAVKSRLGRYYAPNNRVHVDTSPDFTAVEINQREASPSELQQQKDAQSSAGHFEAISREEFEAHRERTLRQLTLFREIRQHSSQASLVVVTLPVPGRNMSPLLYMTWLDCLTGAFSEPVKNSGDLAAESGNSQRVSSKSTMPPMLLLRGNQQNVLTFEL